MPISATYGFKKDTNHVIGMEIESFIERLTKLSQMLSTYTSKISLTREPKTEVTGPTNISIDKSISTPRPKVMPPQLSPGRV
jgi:hypothetical protein